MSDMQMRAHAPEHPFVSIDLGAISANWQAVRRAFHGKRVGAVLKNDAYGLGAARIGPLLATLGCRDFWVATFAEGLALRQSLGAESAGQNIYLLHGMAGRTLAEHAALGLVPVLCNVDELHAARAQATPANPGRVAVQLDTGITRLGLDAAQVDALIASTASGGDGLGSLEIDAWITQLGHFENPAAPECLAQRKLFAEWTAALPAAQRSLATSSTVFSDADWHFEHARVGSALYGVETVPTQPQGLAPVATLQAQVLRVAEVPAGTEVGYAGGYRTPAVATLATLVIGYADGLPLAMGNRGQVVLAGQTAPIVGEISMGLCTVDVSALAPGRVRVGDWAEVYGAHQPLHVLAARIGVNPNALLVPTASRAPRVYTGAKA